jgi:hypothetical protein
VAHLITRNTKSSFSTHSPVLNQIGGIQFVFPGKVNFYPIKSSSKARMKMPSLGFEAMAGENSLLGYRIGIVFLQATSELRYLFHQVKENG